MSVASVSFRYEAHKYSNDGGENNCILFFILFIYFFYYYFFYYWVRPGRRWSLIWVMKAGILLCLTQSITIMPQWIACCFVLTFLSLFRRFQAKRSSDTLLHTSQHLSLARWFRGVSVGWTRFVGGVYAGELRVSLFISPIKFSAWLKCCFMESKVNLSHYYFLIWSPSPVQQLSMYHCHQELHQVNLRRIYCTYI